MLLFVRFRPLVLKNLQNLRFFILHIFQSLQEVFRKTHSFLDAKIQNHFEQTAQ